MCQLSEHIVNQATRSRTVLQQALQSTRQGCNFRHLQPSVSTASSSGDDHSASVPGRMAVLWSNGVSAPRRPPCSGSSGQPTKAAKLLVSCSIVQTWQLNFQGVISAVRCCALATQISILFVDRSLPAAWPRCAPAMPQSAGRAALESTARWQHPAMQQAAAPAVVSTALARSAAAR